VKGQPAEIGYVIKTHGVRGFLRIAFKENCKELSKAEALYFLMKGAHLPFFIEDIEYAGDGYAFVKLEDLHNREEAEAFVRRPVFGPEEYLEAPEADEDNFLQGYMIVDVDAGEIGRVEYMQDMGAYYLLTILAEGRELLIPLHDDLIVEQNDAEKKIYMALPDGLLHPEN